jgi:hypothetical protein
LVKKKALQEQQCRVANGQVDRHQQAYYPCMHAIIEKVPSQNPSDISWHVKSITLNMLSKNLQPDIEIAAAIAHSMKACAEQVPDLTIKPPLF